MAVDFREERKWKITVAFEIAREAVEYVNGKRRDKSVLVNSDAMEVEGGGKIIVHDGLTYSLSNLEEFNDLPTYSFDPTKRGEMYKDVFTEDCRVVPVSRLMSVKTFAKVLIDDIYNWEVNSRFNDDSSKISGSVWEVKEAPIKVLEGKAKYRAQRETCKFQIINKYSNIRIASCKRRAR